jgi:threonine dehydrogenase-like Zn-dependent dehydrogenase
MADPIRIRKAMLYGARDLRLDEESFDPQSLGSDEVFVRTLVSGFSTGTDLANYDGRSTEVPGAPDYPRAVGYNNVGVVELAGPAVKTLRRGDRVFSIRHHRSGFASRESDLLVPVPPGVDAVQASLAYLTHLGTASLRTVRYQAGENVAVVGLGVIGLCTVAAARAMGARVAAIANSDARAELAARMGATETYRSGAFDPARVFAGRGADIVVLTANSWDAWAESMEMVRYAGRVTVLGFPGRNLPPPPFNPLQAKWLYGKQLTVAGAGFLPRVECEPWEVRFNLRRDLEFVLGLMESGDMDLGPAISHRFPYQRMREAYELAISHAKDLTAAVFEWE